MKDICEQRKLQCSISSLTTRTTPNHALFQKTDINVDELSNDSYKFAITKYASTSQVSSDIVEENSQTPSSKEVYIIPVSNKLTEKRNQKHRKILTNTTKKNENTA